MSHQAADAGQGERLLAWANRLTLSRLALVIALGIASAATAGSISSLTVVLLTCIWLSDVVDGPLARRGQRLGAAPRRDGQALDPVVDDLAYAVGFVVLCEVGLVPLGFVLLVLLVRCTFTLTRIVGLTQDRPFPRPRITGKVMGVTLGLGQCCLAAGAAWTLAPFDQDGAQTVILVVMTTTCAIALADFCFVNRAVAREAVSPRRTEPEPAEVRRPAARPAPGQRHVVPVPRTPREAGTPHP